MAEPLLSPAVFLDRDGTLIEDRGYLADPSEVVFYPETVPALRRLQERYRLIIVSNQEGIGMGLLTPEEVDRVNRHVVETLAREGVAITAVYYCPHTRAQGCDCIKPKPFLLRKAEKEHRIDLARSFVVGDHPHDARFAHSVGARGIYLLTGHGLKHRHQFGPDEGIVVAENLAEAADQILNGEERREEEKEAVVRAAGWIRRGGVVAFPTETVYGLGADAFNPLAVARVFEIKGRPHFDPLIVHVADRADLGKLVATVPEEAERLMERFWPGPLTLVLPKCNEVPEIVTSGLPTVAVRMPRHPMTLDLIREAARPIVGPSANPFGYVSPTTAGHVKEQLGDRVDQILDGGSCEVGVESTILAFPAGRPTLLRPGGAALEEIEKIVGPVEIGGNAGESPPAPGMLPSHYAPRTPVRLAPEGTPSDALRCGKTGLLAFRTPAQPALFEHVEILSDTGDLREAAARLFAGLRRLDGLGLDLIVAETVPEEGLGRAIMDRLRRASAMG
jgi:L-threonylcarbamoyladenylate synthase